VYARENFFEENGVTVTNTRFSVPSQTYAMSGITSVKSYNRSPNRRVPIALALIGCGLFFGKIIGIILLILAVLCWILSKPEYQVRLSTASGEATALRSKDQNWISKVVNSVNDAIIHRG